MQLAFVMDPLESIRLDHDTTYALMRESDRRGHAVWHVAPAAVGFGAGGATLSGRRVGMTDDPSRPFEVGPPSPIQTAGLDAVLIRTDPPVRRRLPGRDAAPGPASASHLRDEPAFRAARCEREAGGPSLPGPRAEDLGWPGFGRPGTISRIRGGRDRRQADRRIRGLRGLPGPRRRPEPLGLVEGRDAGRDGQGDRTGGRRGRGARRSTDHPAGRGAPGGGSAPQHGRRVHAQPRHRRRCVGEPRDRRRSIALRGWPPGSAIGGSGWRGSTWWAGS